jgi:NADPH2:quinone reductase
MAEKALVSAAQCIPVPDDVTLEVAASLGMAYGTTMYALEDRAALVSGETLAVLGAAGGVGLAAVKIGKAMGARVIAAASTEAKRALCLEAGADAVVDYVNEDLKAAIKSLTKGKGADVVYDPVGGDFTEKALRATAWKGRYLILGWAAGSIPKIPTNLVLLKGCSIVGVFWGSYAMRDPAGLARSFERLFEMVSDGRVSPHIDKVYPLEEGAEAIRAIGARQVLGKVLVRVEAEA